MADNTAILGGKPAVTDRIQFRMWPEVTREDRGGDHVEDEGD